MTMNAPFVADERSCEENEHHDKHDTLFVFRKFENVQKALHSVWRSFGITFVVLERLHVLIQWLSC
jgi:hypothetical protein